MDRNLRMAILHFLIAALVIWIWLCLEGCVPSHSVMGVCRHEATFAMSVMGEKHECRVAQGLWGGRLHAKAQVFLDGQWKWLCVDYPAVFPCRGDDGFTPNQFYIPKVWMMGVGWKLKEGQP